MPQVRHLLPEIVHAPHSRGCSEAGRWLPIRPNRFVYRSVKKAFHKRAQMDNHLQRLPSRCGRDVSEGFADAHFCLAHLAGRRTDQAGGTGTQVQAGNCRRERMRPKNGFKSERAVACNDRAELQTRETHMDVAEPRPYVSCRWFALRVKSRHEKLVATILRNKGYEEFAPFYRDHRLWSDPIKPGGFPLFPGYVFCRLDPQYRLPILITPGVLYFVGVGRIPVPIDDGEILAIQSAVQSGLPAERSPFMETGQLVRLEAGPLKGLEGFFIEVRKQRRIIVSVTLLRRSVAVEIDPNWVRPLGVVRHNSAKELQAVLSR